MRIGSFNPVPTNGKFNGMQAMIMQSQENLDKVLEDFETAIAAGLNPNDVKDEILAKRKLKESDFTTFDIAILNRKVEAMYRAYHR